MNILVLSNCEVVEHQGSGYIIINTAKSLRTLGHTVDIVPPTAFDFLPGLKSRARTYRMAVGMGLWMYRNKKNISKYQLIIVYGAESSLALYVLLNVLHINIPVILHSNGLELHVAYRMQHFESYLTKRKKWYHFNKSFLYNYCYRNVDSIITVSKYDLDFAINFLKITNDKVFYNEACLPDVFFNSKENITQKKKIITYCGTWVARKGIESIRLAMPAILRTYPDYTFRLIGVSDQFKAEDYFPDDILQKIEVFPMVEKKEKLIELYAESSIFLFPSFSESFGLVVAEAMFCKCAVITGPTGFAADIKDSEEAIVLQIPDAKNVQMALEKLINNDELRTKLGENGRRRVELLQWSNFRLKLNEILIKVLNRRSLKSDFT
jgi:glycosyltransferase involved in cell wall biosynthesis